VKSSGLYVPERGLGAIDITGGRIGAATLVSKDGKLIWSFAKEAHTSKPLNRLIQFGY
jgi:hypothetical protein